MLRWTRALFVLLLTLLISGLAVRAAQAGQYQLSVSRKTSNFYKVDGQPYYIETRMCLELALRTVILLDARGGTVTFYPSYGAPTTTCSVTGVYEEQSFHGGRAVDIYGNIVSVESILVPANL